MNNIVLSWKSYIKTQKEISVAGISRVRAEYPNQLDYDGLVVCF